MRLHFAILSILLIAASCSRPAREGADSRPVPDKIRLRTTPVKDQGASSACWIYAMLACIETERIEQYGDSVNLSADWLIRHLGEEVAMQKRMMGRRTNATQRGMGPDALRLIEHYGIIPEGTRTGKSDGFYFYSMHYTPRQFANSVYREGDWQWLTSFTHHPYGERFALEVPDNHHFNEFLNVHPDSLLAITVRSIEQRHPVFWEGTMKTIENIGAKTGEQLKQRRQKLFEQGVLTDDHAMAIVGIHTKKDGTPCFIMKNSWGTAWNKKGYGLIPLNDFLLRTIMVGVRKG